MKPSRERSEQIRGRMREYIDLMEQRRKEMDVKLDAARALPSVTGYERGDARDRCVWEFIGSTTFFREELARLLDELEGK